MEIADKVAVVVGGASGMARAAAEKLAERGARVAIVDLPSSKGAEVLNGGTIRLDGGQRFAPK